jgi:hypothetical protein
MAARSRSKRRQTEAERLRQHNEEMKLALAENLTVLEARRRLAFRRWKEFEAGLDRRRRCGTSAAPNAGQAQPSLEPPHALVEASAPRFWWQDRD